MKFALNWFPVEPLPTPEEAVTPELPGLVDCLVGLIPQNPFEAAADGALLRGLSVFVLAVIICLEIQWIIVSLPVMLEEPEENLKLSRESYPLILSLLAPMNKAGSALFQAASVVFLAALYDVNLPLSGMGALFIAVFLVALTVALVPSAGVVTLAPALDALGIPLAGMAVLLGVDRIPDMFRSFINGTGHMVWAVVVEELAFGRTGPGGSREGEAATTR